MTRRDVLSIVLATLAAVLAWSALNVARVLYHDHLLLHQVVQALRQPPPPQEKTP